MWNNLKNWQKSIIFFITSFVIIYVLGKLFIPAKIITQPDGPPIKQAAEFSRYVRGPIIYSIFLVLPILIIKFSNKKFLKIIASIILTFFLLIILLGIILMWPEIYKEALRSGISLGHIIDLLFGIPIFGVLLIFWEGQF